jgi:hypothetical protein
MKRRSLQEIEDFYVNKGLSGSALREVLENDADYQRLLEERKEQLTRKFDVSVEEQERYVLSTDSDYEILGKIHKLEKKPLSKEDKNLVQFIRTQLEEDWRSPIIKVLNKLLGKYKKR